MPSPKSDIWFKQSLTTPLFEDLIWSQPERMPQAGKLLIIGGNIHGFSASAVAYAEAKKAGIGSARVVLPDVLRKMIGKTLAEAEYTPSTPSGSFAYRSLAELLELANWSDLTLLAGDIGRNSETAMLHEAFIKYYEEPLVITKDSLDSFVNDPEPLINRPQTLVVASLAQLQRITTKAEPSLVVTADMSLVALVDLVSKLSSKTAASYITKYLGNLIVAVDGKVSTTKLKTDLATWRVNAASYAAVWWLQNLSQPFEALSCSVYSYLKSFE